MLFSKYILIHLGWIWLFYKENISYFPQCKNSKWICVWCSRRVLTKKPIMTKYLNCHLINIKNVLREMPYSLMSLWRFCPGLLISYIFSESSFLIRCAEYLKKKSEILSPSFVGTASSSSYVYFQKNGKRPHDMSRY